MMQTTTTARSIVISGIRHARRTQKAHERRAFSPAASAHSRRVAAKLARQWRREIDRFEAELDAIGSENAYC